MRFDVLLQPCKRQRARRLAYSPGIFVGILDRRTHLIGRYQNHVIDQILDHRPGIYPNLLYSDAVGENTHLFQFHPSPRLARLIETGCIVRFDTDNPDFRLDRLDKSGDTRNQATATNGHENRIDMAWVLANNFMRDSALTRHHVEIVEGMDKCKALLLGEL